MAEFSNLEIGLAYDDVYLSPGYTDFTQDEIDFSVDLGGILLRLGVCSAPMDRVTGSRLAIALAKCGGLGIIHRNFKIIPQAREVAKVKAKGLPVGAAFSSKPGFERRVEALVEAKVDLLVVDSAHGFSKFLIEAVKTTKRNWPQIPVMAGNVATYDGARALIDAGADVLIVGMGSGSTCSTRIISGMGVPQVTALMETSRAAKDSATPIIADGGIRYSGDIVKALALGASAVMMGLYLGSAIESPGKTIKLTPDQVPSRFKSIIDGRHEWYSFKEIRGMGSPGAQELGARMGLEDGHHGELLTRNKPMAAEGIEGLVPVRGTVRKMIDQMLLGMTQGFYYVGARNIRELWQKARFIRVTSASQIESHPHDILITNPGENYV